MLSLNISKNPKGIVKKLNYTEQRSLPTSGYRPSEYWIERGKTYPDRFNYTKEFKLQEPKPSPKPG